jgi:hypothetical protein
MAVVKLISEASHGNAPSEEEYQCATNSSVNKIPEVVILSGAICFNWL